MIKAVHYPPFQYFQITDESTGQIEHLVASKCILSDTGKEFYDENNELIAFYSDRDYTSKMLENYPTGVHNLITDGWMPSYPCELAPVGTEMEHIYITIKEMNNSKSQRCWR